MHLPCFHGCEGALSCRKTIYDDPFIRNYIEDLLKNIRTQAWRPSLRSSMTVRENDLIVASLTVGAQRLCAACNAHDKLSSCTGSHADPRQKLACQKLRSNILIAARSGPAVQHALIALLTIFFFLGMRWPEARGWGARRWC